ncbi:hypothetical protein SAMN05421690_100165 [Nitrosomonas sp. Nm51]|nr:hypothetical protein SAMN05421690_100165 [Nitrosomonas sp. Nm51]
MHVDYLYLRNFIVWFRKRFVQSYFLAGWVLRWLKTTSGGTHLFAAITLVADLQCAKYTLHAARAVKIAGKNCCQFTPLVKNGFL